MRTRSIARARWVAAAGLMGITVLATEAAFAGPMPPAHFTYDVVQGRTILEDCTPLRGSTVGGDCGSPGTAPGYAGTSGGIGTPSYLPTFGTGTAIDSMSTWTSGGRVHSNAEMTYSFEATGPAGDDLIPIDVLSTGLISSSGNAGAYLSLVISGPDPDHPGSGGSDWSAPLLDLTGFCFRDDCFSDWGTPGQQLTDGLCVVNGDLYTVTIDALTTAGPGRHRHGDGSASAQLDPKIILDPPTVADCPLNGSPSDYSITTSPGASTGYLVTAVPEPPVLGLAVIGALGLGGVGLRRRRGRITLTAAGRPS